MPQPSRAVSNAIALHDLYASIQSMLDYRLRKALTYDWNEDYLSRSLCEILRDLSPFSFRAFDGSIAEVHAVFEKHSGKREFDRGDIGATIDVTTRGGKHVVGCGYLEAKRRYRKTRRYDEIRWPQLERIAGNVPHALLLLYDFEPAAFNADISGDAALGDGPDIEARAVVLPVTVACGLHINTVDLYAFSTPLAHQVCYRYLHALDLEPVDDPVAADGFFDRHDLDPAYRLKLLVTHREAEATPAASTVPAGMPPVAGSGAALEDDAPQRYLTADE